MELMGGARVLVLLHSFHERFSDLNCERYWLRLDQGNWMPDLFQSAQYCWKRSPVLKSTETNLGDMTYEYLRLQLQPRCNAVSFDLAMAEMAILGVYHILSTNIHNEYYDICMNKNNTHHTCVYINTDVYIYIHDIRCIDLLGYSCHGPTYIQNGLAL